MSRRHRRGPVYIPPADLSDLTRSNAQIARDLGISEKSVWRQRVRAGLHKPSRKQINEHVVAVLAKRGKTDGQIAAALGVTAQGVQKARKRLGIAPSFRRGRRPKR